MWASEAPCSSISKNQMKSFKPGHHIAKILLFRTHHLWNSTTELILTYICILLLLSRQSIRSIFYKKCGNIIVVSFYFCFFWQKKDAISFWFWPHCVTAVASICHNRRHIDYHFQIPQILFISWFLRRVNASKCNFQSVAFVSCLFW